MAVELTKQESDEIIPSLQKFFREELEQDLSEMRARFFLDYIVKEIAPYAYNKGVKDSEAYFRSKVEDLTATCFEDGLTYWVRKRK
jgi:uncharacterized protein (DUF2164 family)